MPANDPTADPSPSSSKVGSAGWQLDDYAVAGSTNDLARTRPAWSAVLARSQTAGRGRFGRGFVSDPGGLWLSAVLPAEGGASRWAGFSLMAGCHLLRMLQSAGVPEVRLRWPNDLMALDKKLAGILIEQDTREKLVVGLGLNVTNAPWSNDPELRHTSTRLADLLDPVPSVETLAVWALDALADAHADMLTHGLSAAIQELNAHWTEPRWVRVALLDGEIFSGAFSGLDPDGNLRFLNADGSGRVIDHHRVERLTEVSQFRKEEAPPVYRTASPAS